MRFKQQRGEINRVISFCSLIRSHLITLRRKAKANVHLKKTIVLVLFEVKSEAKNLKPEETATKLSQPQKPRIVKKAGRRIATETAKRGRNDQINSQGIRRRAFLKC